MRTSTFLACLVTLAGGFLLAQGRDKPTSPPAPNEPVKARKFCAKSSSNNKGYPLGNWSYTQVVVQGKLSDQGGAGQLVLDLNEHLLDGYGEVVGGTKIGLTTFEVKFVPVPRPRGDGPPIYRLDGERLPERMLLVVPEEANRPWRLILADQKGQPSRVVLLEP